MGVQGGEHRLSEGKQHGLAAHLISFVKNWTGHSSEGHEDSVLYFKEFDRLIHELFQKIGKQADLGQIDWFLAC